MNTTGAGAMSAEDFATVLLKVLGLYWVIATTLQFPQLVVVSNPFPRGQLPNIRGARNIRCLALAPFAASELAAVMTGRLTPRCSGPHTGVRPGLAAELTHR